MEPKKAKEILTRYSAGLCTEDEKAWVESWYLNNDISSEPVSHQEIETAMNHVRKYLPALQTRQRSLWPRIAAAASIVFALSAGAYLYLHQPKTVRIANTEGLQPAQKGVTLTLSNGQQVNLSVLKSGKAINTDGSQIDHHENGISYDHQPQEVVWHTVTNNSAEKFALVLNDGTEADLDIHSSITYPTAFTGSERKVTVTGQTYFKVKHNAKQPFRVQVNTTMIEDIGTEFNIDAYEPTIKTTLVEGAASVAVNNDKITLTPGKQAISENGTISSTDADLEAVTDWLQGEITFNNEPLEVILQKVERIYEVKFNWRDDASRKMKFNGVVSRKKKLATVLNYFRKTGPVDFIAQGKNITVTRKK